MKTLLILPLVVLAFGLAGCDKKPNDQPKPKAGLSIAVSPAA